MPNRKVYPARAFFCSRRKTISTIKGAVSRQDYDAEQPEGFGVEVVVMINGRVENASTKPAFSGETHSGRNCHVVDEANLVVEASSSECGRGSDL